jgi:hypothetical protein
VTPFPGLPVRGSGEHRDPANQVTVEQSNQVNFVATRAPSGARATLFPHEKPADVVAVLAHLQGIGLPKA